MTRNQIALSEHLENSRHNRATESETYRHNVSDEAVRRYAAGASYAMASASLAGVAEQRRHNQEVEAQGWVSTNSLAQLQGVQGETAQYNAMTNRIVGVYNARTNLINARTQQSQQREAARHNIVSEALEGQRIGVQERRADEEQRHNKTTEAQGWLTAGTRGFRDTVAGGAQLYNTLISGGVLNGVQNQSGQGLQEGLFD